MDLGSLLSLTGVSRGQSSLQFIHNARFTGQTAQIRHLHWPILIITFTGGLSTFVVQTFMVYRYWTWLAKNSAKFFIYLEYLLC